MEHNPLAMRRENIGVSCQDIGVQVMGEKMWMCRFPCFSLNSVLNLYLLRKTLLEDSEDKGRLKKTSSLCVDYLQQNS